MITDRIGRHKVLLPINQKNYNFREKKNSQVMKERENLHKKLTKGDVSILKASLNKFPKGDFEKSSAEVSDC